MEVTSIHVHAATGPAGFEAEGFRIQDALTEGQPTASKYSRQNEKHKNLKMDHKQFDQICFKIEKS